MANALVEHCGLDSPPSQPTVSRWLHAKADPEPANRPALHAYIDLHTPSSTTSSDGKDPQWDDVVRQLAGEPLLGPRQARFIDTLIDRVGAGLTNQEVELMVMLGRSLGVFPSASPDSTS